ncbi:hypothetical protein PILCRDRAFT_179622 [Piloderma croceum F 1598]|uniref:Uncharacterized protein n=1 Tax=Piloderma croceum (strain F 1598) TaxID=765440 RepID=A0A0C3GF49_PILCF|nr:hypothetical protein PILCRDRAFT_179622 [Piloderma croceum F 1598]
MTTPLVPQPSKCELDCFNAELAALWGDLVATHFPSQNIDPNIHSIPKFDITYFHCGLKDFMYRTAHKRYETAWLDANGSTKVQHVEDGIYTKRRNERFAAASRRLKQQQVDHESEQDGEEAGGGPNIHS